jgi:hypothetical protein
VRREGEDFGQNIREHPWGTHWEHMEYIGNLIGTHLELEGNIWEQKENEKIPPPPPANPKLKRKKIKAL